MDKEESLVEGEVPTPQGKSQAKAPNGLTKPSIGLMYETLMMIEDNISGIHEMYWILDAFHLRALRLEDKVTSGPSNYLAMYEENLHASLHFPLHDFIQNVLDRYQVIPT